MTNTVTREPFLEGKAQYSWPPCTNQFRSAAFDIKNIINFFTKHSALTWRWTTESFPLVSIQDICNLLSDLNVVMRKTDALMGLWKWYPYQHHLSWLSLCTSISYLCKSIDLCTDATSLFLICSASHAHTLSLSLLYLALFTLHYILHKNPWRTFPCYHWSQQSCLTNTVVSPKGAEHNKYSLL